MDKTKILTRGQNCITYGEFEEIADLIERYYYFSSTRFWMWKMFQFGFVYDKRAERAKRKVVQCNVSI